MNNLCVASLKLRSVISNLEQVKDVRVQEILNNLKEEEDNIDTLIMNMGEESEVHSSRKV